MAEILSTERVAQLHADGLEVLPSCFSDLLTPLVESHERLRAELAAAVARAEAAERERDYALFRETGAQSLADALRDELAEIARATGPMSHSDAAAKARQRVSFLASAEQGCADARRDLRELAEAADMAASILETFRGDITIAARPLVARTAEKIRAALARMKESSDERRDPD